MNRFTILASVFALAGFGFVGTTSAGTTPGPLDCGDKVYECVNGYEWEVWFQCGSSWQNDNTWVNLDSETANLDASEVDGYGDCRMSMDNMEGDDDIAVYQVGCSLPTQAGGSGGGGGGGGHGRNVLLQVRNLGPADCL